MRRVVFVLAALFLAYLAPPCSVAVSKTPSPCIHAGARCIAINLAVTAETIAKTICIRGWTADRNNHHVRDMKMRLGSAAGLAPDAAEAMFLDHIIPQKLGGHPSDESNLPLQEAAEAKLKDNVEHSLHALVCSGLAPLDAARAAIAKDWRTAAQLTGPTARHWAHTWRSTIIFLISAIDFAGLRCFGHAFEQFMMVWQR